MSELTINSGDWQARIRPDIGGLITALTKGGVPILRTMPLGATHPLESACFAMVPWCNRIANGAFSAAGRQITLSRNFAPEPHAIHGHGWQAAWIVTDAAPDCCTLVYHHPANGAGWPWAYAAEQRIALLPDGCVIDLTLTNRAETPMPAGVGLHPYIRRRPESRVSFIAAGLCAVGADMLPTGLDLPADHFADFAAAGGALLPPETIDHCYAGWDGSARVSDDCGTVTLTATAAAHLHLYAPHDDDAPQPSDALCLEPVSHLPDALNRDAGAMAILAPGEGTQLSLRIGASAPA